MRRLWSQAGATGGNQSQMAPLRKRLKQADRQPVATHGNRFGAHGKEAVDDYWRASWRAPDRRRAQPKRPCGFARITTMVFKTGTPA
jgi:hypothetical protein